MPTLLQGIQGFAGASGVGILCLSALFLGGSVFATNLPTLADVLASSGPWSGIVTVPILVVAYVVGLLATALIESRMRVHPLELGSLQGVAAQRYSQLEQEAEILSGSFVGFILLGAAAFLNVWAFPGWRRTLTITGASLLLTAASAWRMSRDKHEAAKQWAVQNNGRTSEVGGKTAIQRSVALEVPSAVVRNSAGRESDPSASRDQR